MRPDRREDGSFLNSARRRKAAEICQTEPWSYRPVVPKGTALDTSPQAVQGSIGHQRSVSPAALDEPERLNPHRGPNREHFPAHVRPIVRGKASAPVEFGAKIAVSLVKGLSFVDQIGWNNFAEAALLKNQVETHRR